ncbi:AAA family ATPase [Massilia sp. Se16.2.3]|uniref:AAA family ATPase n=1 Tax=Massilia sp. Se16.2.3 TaxID=2709303 RepID=UPI001E481A62|nr:AAA family ATPase [Massilia sp. Se16.2.3]
MKILRIAGRNLASLAGDFCVDFESEPLASSGLFAISGPTGAGKSTLLDALCLAFYMATRRACRDAAAVAPCPTPAANRYRPSTPATCCAAVRPRAMRKSISSATTASTTARAGVCAVRATGSAACCRPRT